VATALVYSGYELIRFRRFLSGSFDLVIFDQAVRGYAHLHAPVSIARGVADGIGAHFSVLGDHWSPIIALLAPLYWIHEGPATLLVAQAVLFALAIPPLWVFTRRQLGAASAYFVSAAYALSLPIMAAATVDFHEVAFVPVLTALMAERFQAGRRLQAALAAVALLMVKEDMGLLVAGYGMYLVLTARHCRGRGLTGLSFIVGGVAATWVTTRLLIPASGGSPSFYWAYGQLGSSVTGAALHTVSHPLQALRLLINPDVKLRTIVGLLAAFGFLPLASPMTVAVVPLLAERMLASGYPLWWTAKFQYDAFLVMMLCCAAVDGAARLQRVWPRLPRVQVPPATAWAAAVCAAAVAFVPFSPLGVMVHPKFYGVNPRMRAAQAATAAIPSGAEVEAVNNIGPRLSGRDEVLLLDGSPRWAPWVVADTKGLDFPFCSPRQQQQEAAFLEAHGYRLVLADDGYVVLHRPPDARTAEALAHPAAAPRIHTNICS